MLTARGSQLEREFGFGAVRQLFEGTAGRPGRRAELLRGCGGLGRVGVRRGRRADPADARRRLVRGAARPLLADRQPRRAAAGRARRRRPAVVRHRLAARPGVPAAPARGPAGAASSRPCAPASRTTDEALLAELAEDLATVPVHPGPLDADGDGRPGRGERLGERRRTPPFVAACHRTTGGNPLLLRQLLRALQVEGVRPDASHADTVNAIGSRAVSSMVLMRLRPAAGRLHRGRPRDRRARRRLRAGRRRRPGRAGRAATAAARSRRWPGPRCSAPDRPLGFVHPLVGDAVYQALSGGERELSHERAAAELTARGRHAGAGGRAPHARAAPRRPQAVGCCGAPPRRPPTGAPPTRRRTYLERALAEPPDAATSGRRCCSSWAGSGR